MHPLKKLSAYVVLSGTLIIWMIKFVVRPFVHIPYWLKPFTGIAPNLIGSFLLPFGACWFFHRIFRMQTIQDLKIATWFGLVLVIINEYIQMIPIFYRTFDYLDILFSVVGVICGYFAFAKAMSSRIFKTYP